MENSRKKDLIAILISTVIAVLLFLLIQNLFKGSGELVWLSYVGIVCGIVTIVMSYFESKDNDAFVTGQTQRMGVVNSFVVSGVVIILVAFKFGLILPIIVMDLGILIVRDLGRKKREEIKKQFLGKNTSIIKVNGKGKYVVELDSKPVTVYSKESLKINDKVIIKELKGSYLYVKKQEA